MPRVVDDGDREEHIGRSVFVWIEQLGIQNYLRISMVSHQCELVQYPPMGEDKMLTSWS